MKRGCIVGVSDHAGWAILVTVTRDGTLIDRRRVELVDDSLPAIPHHHLAQALPLAAAVKLVRRVRASAEIHAGRALDAITTALPSIRGIALRSCPPLPRTIAGRIADYRARNVADWVMYRKALAGAAKARNIAVHWYERNGVYAEAARILSVKDFDAYFRRMGKDVGSPWNADHKLALAAAIALANVAALKPRRGK